MIFSPWEDTENSRRVLREHYWGRVCFCQSNVKNIRSYFEIKKTFYFTIFNLFYQKLSRQGSHPKYIFFSAEKNRKLLLFLEVLMVTLIREDFNRFQGFFSNLTPIDLAITWRDE